MNDLVKTKSDNPISISPELGRRVSYFSNCLDPAGMGFTIPFEKAPTENERKILALRGAQVDDWLRPCGRLRALQEVTAIFSTRGVRSGTETDVQAMMAIYVEDLADLPTFALAHACKDFRQGVVGDRKWIPTQAEIRYVAGGYLANFERERRKIANILSAKVDPPRVSPERRARALAHVEETRRALQMPDPDPPRSGYFPPKPELRPDVDVKAEAEARLATIDYSKPAQLSPELLALFGIRPKPERDEPSEDAA